MTRGDLVTIALMGGYGKPRPALVIQSDLFDEHPSVTILPVTSVLREAPLFRIPVQPDANNGLLKPSQIIVDKAQIVHREKIGNAIGRLDNEALLAVNRALVVFLGFARIICFLRGQRCIVMKPRKQASHKADTRKPADYQRIFATASSTRSTAMISMPEITCFGLLALGIMACVKPSLAASFNRSWPR